MLKQVYITKEYIFSVSIHILQTFVSILHSIKDLMLKQVYITKGYIFSVSIHILQTFVLIETNFVQIPRLKCSYVYFKFEQCACST